MLTESEANELIRMLKKQEKVKAILFPDSGKKTRINIISSDSKEKFLIDIYQSRIDITEYFNHMNHSSKCPLARLDVGEHQVHRNPDGEKLTGSHLHIYKDGYESRWAYPVPKELGQDLDNKIETVLAFFKYCIVKEHGDIINQKEFYE